VEALGRGLETIVTRHESLRTTFANVNGHLRQVIAAPGPLPLPVIDLRAVPETERESHAWRIATDEAGRPFDLSRDPGFRTTVLRLDDTDHVLLLTTHEAVADPWSLDILLREMSQLYAASGAERGFPLPPLAIQYADYAVWQRRRLPGPVLDAHLAYWRRRLAGAPTLDLPTDRPRPAVPTFRGAVQPFRLSSRLSERLKAMGRQEGVTLFMTLLAAFQVLLHRYSGQDDVVVGVSVAERTRAELEGLIGCFINTLALRTDLSGRPTFRDLLARVRQVATEAYSHQDAPFQKVVEALQPNRTPGHPPLFRVMFALENTPTWTPTLAGLSVHRLEVHRDTVAVDLSLSMKDTAQGLSGTLTYSTDLFEADTIARVVGHLETLLDGAATDPDRPVAQLPLLTEPERRRILGEWNDTHADYPRQCVHQLIEAQATRTPDAVAVVFEDRWLTYRELNRRATRLAHRLQRLGVGPDERVGIYVERSLDMVVGLLGILKAGGAYLPLDPDYPRDRLAFMLEDAGARVVLTQEYQVTDLPRSTAAIVCLDASPGSDEARDAEAVDALVTPEQAAYVIYTSGSTGRPKGVLIPHRALVNLLEAMRRVLGLSAGDVVLALSTISFDIATLELFLPLTVGARVVVAGRQVAKDPARLSEVLQRTGVTVMQATPTAWRLLVEAGWRGSPDLTMLSGGEALPQKLADQLRQRGASLWNFYGPTETTIYSTGARVQAGGPITIGRPIANTQVYLLDRHGSPVPIGVAGELYIGGDGLARGYLSQPAQTADSFIPNPFSPEPAARLYKTGDRARYRSDGTLEFLGRADGQVKLRGFRIELGEVEVVLASHPAVRAAAVALREDTPGDPRLVAYVVPDQSREPATATLIAHLKTQLPAHMMPAAFVMLGALPLTPNGKVDRDALPRPSTIDPGAPEPFVAPRTPTEAALAQIWGEVLGVERVGVQDTLFDLGGHSLMAIRIVSRIREAFGVEVPLRLIFDTPTLAEIARAVVQAGAEAAGHSEGARVPVDTDGRMDAQRSAEMVRDTPGLAEKHE
jgi:amino acid adenylation domain-containing protein